MGPSAHQLARLEGPLGAGIFVVWFLAAILLKPYRREDPTVVNVSRAIELIIVMVGTMVLALEMFFHKETLDLRGIFFVFAPLALLLLLGARYAITLTAAATTRKWPRRVAVFGEGPDALRVVERIGRTPDRGSVAGVILPERSGTGEVGNPVRLLGRASDIAEMINREHLGRIIIAGHVPEEEIDECCRVSKRMGVIVSRAFSTPVADDARVEFAMLYGMHVLDLRPVAFTRTQEIVKRAFDIMAAFLLLLLNLPIIVAAAIAIKLTSSGPILYNSPRVGKGGRHFLFLKFRTMTQERMDRTCVAASNEQSGHLFKIRNDPRVTRVGRILRRYSVDELPQLLNVLMGQMSLIGPRPLPIEDLDPDGMSKRFATWAEQRSRVQPGITGLWQVSGRSDAGFERMMELDIRYIKEWSLMLDIFIMIKTPRAVFTARGAY
jgi:exopolysaccharide biosynthesis polyprenyl glycosylphosphotransferase